MLPGSYGRSSSKNVQTPANDSLVKKNAMNSAAIDSSDRKNAQTACLVIQPQSQAQGAIELIPAKAIRHLLKRVSGQGTSRDEGFAMHVCSYSILKLGCSFCR